MELVPRDDNPEPVKATRSTSVPDFFKLKYPKLSSVNANSKLRRRRISVFLPDVWNSLPLELRSVHPIELFKTRLKGTPGVFKHRVPAETTSPGFRPYKMDLKYAI